MINLNCLKEQRHIKGLSLEEVSKLLGYSSANAYWKIEKGITKLTVDSMQKLIKILDINISDLIREE